MNCFDMNPTGRNSFCECAAASPRMEPTPPNPNPPCTEKSGCAALKGFSLAMAYVPMQCFENLYCPEDALCAQFDSCSIKKFAAPDREEMGMRVLDNCAEEHQK